MMKTSIHISLSGFKSLEEIQTALVELIQPSKNSKLAGNKATRGRAAQINGEWV
jgi:hypothetical protein